MRLRLVLTVALGALTASAADLFRHLSLLNPVGPVTEAGVVNAASFAPGPIAPGEIVTIFGAGLGPATLANLQLTADRRVMTTLADTRVLFNGIAAPLIYVQERQLSAIVPYGVQGRSRVDLQIEYLGFRSNTVSLAVATAAPGLFTLNSTGRGPGAVLNQDYRVNSASNPAERGSIVILYGTGEGVTDYTVDGALASSTFPPKPRLPVSVRIGGVAAEVLYAGGAPGLVHGVLQVNARVPATVVPGGAVPVTVTVGATATSPAGVTIAVR